MSVWVKNIKNTLTQECNVGILGVEHEHIDLRNTYKISRTGSLVPLPAHFFYNSFSKIRDLREISLRKDGIEDIKDQTKILIGELKDTIEEIILVADPESSFLEENPKLIGEYSICAYHFFNTRKLRTLYNLLHKVEKDIDNEKNPNFRRLMFYYSCLQQRFTKFEKENWHEFLGDLKKGVF
jgi:hypothetical protein